jgi:imidazolonepropionase-like amidohydrolase
MGIDGDVGTLEVGKRADLLVLDADPLTDISNIRTGRFVMIAGAVYRNADLWRAIGFGVPE